MFYKKVFLKVSQNSQETTCVRASFLLKLQEKETTVQLFFCEFCEIFKSKIFFLYRIPPDDCLCRFWREVKRDILTLQLLANFEEC